MSDLIKKTAAELAAAMTAGEASAVEVAQAHLDRIGAVDEEVKAFLHVAADDALAQAREVDRKRAAGEPVLLHAASQVEDLGLLGGSEVVVAEKVLGHGGLRLGGGYASLAWVRIAGRAAVNSRASASVRISGGASRTASGCTALTRKPLSCAAW